MEAFRPPMRAATTGSVSQSIGTAHDYRMDRAAGEQGNVRRRVTLPCDSYYDRGQTIAGCSFGAIIKPYAVRGQYSARGQISPAAWS
jgi:hypothetical protein